MEAPCGAVWPIDFNDLPGIFLRSLDQHTMTLYWVTDWTSLRRETEELPDTVGISHINK